MAARKITRRFESPPMQGPDGNFIVFLERLGHVYPTANEERRPLDEKPVPVWTEWVRVIQPGNNKSVPEFVVDDTYRSRYRDLYVKWLAFKEAGGEQPIVDGTPLTEWTAISLDDAEALEGCGIHTVEMLGAISDPDLPRFGPGTRARREKAREFVQAKTRSAPIDALRKQVEALQQQLIGGGGASVGNLGALIEAAVEKALGGANDNASKAKPLFSRRKNGAEANEAAD